MRPRQRRAAACAIFLAWAVLGLAQAAPAPASDSSNSPGPMERSTLPSFQDCSAWSEISSGDADLQTLHTQMCARSGPAAPPAPAEAPPDRPKEIKPTPEPVAESISVAQQNFALIRDGAKVLASNPGAKKVAGILDDDSDTFMRNDCRDDKWVVLELSQVVKVSRIELAQHELYSSRVKEFEVRGRQTHPRTDGVEPSKALNSTAWKLVGYFTAERVKGVQNFAVERPIWARFLLVRFLTHYGAEPVCAVNGLAVYGKSAAEELEDQLAEDLEGLLAEESDKKEGEDSGSGAASAEQIAQALGVGDNPENGGVGEQKSELERGEREGKESEKDGVGAAGSDAAVSPAPAPAPVDPASGATGAPSATPTVADPGAPAPSPAPAKASNSNEASNGKLDDGSTATNATVSPVDAPKQDSQQQQAAAETQNPPGAAGTNTSDAGAIPSPTGASTTAPTADSKAVASIPDAPAPPADADLANATPATTAAIPTGPGTTPATSPPADTLDDTLEPLPVPKTKAGGGIYETLVQEIRVAKAAQRQSSKALEALQRNVTALTAALSRVTTEYQVSESELAARVEALVEARLAALHGRVAALGEALDRSSKREHAALSLLAMLGGALAVSLRGMEAKRWPRARAAVVALALANGAVGVALHMKSAR